MRLEPSFHCLSAIFCSYARLRIVQSFAALFFFYQVAG